MNGREWMLYAACRGAPADLFFPTAESGRKVNPAVYNPARAYCSACEVRAACEQWALDHDERMGMWGGTTPNDRERMVPPHGSRRRWARGCRCEVCAAGFEETLRRRRALRAI